MKIIFIGGWGITSANLTQLYKNFAAKRNFYFFSWSEVFVIERTNSHQITIKNLTTKIHTLLNEECTIVAWSLSAFCIHHYLEKIQWLKPDFRFRIKKIVLIACARSFVKSNLNHQGIPSKILQKMSAVIEKSMKVKQKNPPQGICQMMFDFYQKTFNASIILNSTDAKMNQQAAKYSLIAKKILTTNRELWLAKDSFTWEKTLIAGLDLLRNIILIKPLPYSVLLLQGKEDLLLDHSSAKKLANDFSYQYLNLPRRGHFIPYAEILNILV